MKNNTVSSSSVALEERLSPPSVIFDGTEKVFTLDDAEHAFDLAWGEITVEITEMNLDGQVRSNQLPIGTHPISLERSEVPEDIALSMDFNERILRTAPCLLEGYGRINGNVHRMLENYMVDESLAIVDGLYTGQHKGKELFEFPVTVNIIENLAITHYLRTTLPPSKKAYDAGKKTAKFIDSLSKFEEPFRVLELGTGSGIISASIAKNITKNPVEITATDISGACLMAAETTREINGISRDILKFKKGDWYEAVPYQKFHMIVSNPPYHPSFVAQNPFGMKKYYHLADPLALDGGLDGLEFYRKTLQGHDRLLPGGYFVFQVSPRATPMIRDLAQSMLGPRYKNSIVFSQNKQKEQPQAKGFMVLIETNK